MRLREQSELGWLMLQMLGAIALPTVARDVVKKKGALAIMHASRASGKAQSLRLAVERQQDKDSWPRAGTDRVTGSAQPQTRSPGPALTVTGRAKALATAPFPPHPDGPRCVECGARLGGTYGDVCMNCDVDPPDDEDMPTTQTYDTQDGLWWLSYANETGCAGVAIVQLTGEPQTAARANAEARRLGIVPVDDSWQCAGTQAPEEERALMEAYAGRFLTTAQAAAAFGAQSIGSFEEENPGLVFPPDALDVVDGGRDG